MFPSYLGTINLITIKCSKKTIQFFRKYRKITNYFVNHLWSKVIIKEHATFHIFLNGNFQLTQTELKETCDFDYRNFLSTLILCEIIRIKRCTAVVSKNLLMLYALQITRSSQWIPTIISLQFNFSFCFSLFLSLFLSLIHYSL